MQVDVVVIGAGAVGLACAMELGRQGQRVIVVERHRAIAQETSSRNSGVVHAGIYYPSGSLKAELCVEGRELLYARCVRHRLSHRQIGKLIVATDDSEVAVLESLRLLALENGAGEVSLIDGSEVRRLEPEVRAVAALLSPRTGIVDTHELCASYARDARSLGVDIVFGTTVLGVHEEKGWHLETVGPDGARFVLQTPRVVNAAGLGSNEIARRAGLPIPAARYCKGDYFCVRGPRVSRLVYPVPSAAGLGIHLTVDLAGAVRAGPDTEWIETPRYDVDPEKAPVFAQALRRFLPNIDPDDLSPDYAGVRPKRHGKGEPKADFGIVSVSGTFVHLLGIESPGLTASEAIGLRVAAQLA